MKKGKKRFAFKPNDCIEQYVAKRSVNLMSYTNREHILPPWIKVMALRWANEDNVFSAVLLGWAQFAPVSQDSSFHQHYEVIFHCQQLPSFISINRVPLKEARDSFTWTIDVPVGPLFLDFMGVHNVAGSSKGKKNHIPFKWKGILLKT